VVSITFAGGILKGSPGCGRFSGTYSGSDDRLTISAQWTDDSEASCDSDEKEDAAKILQALGNVRQTGLPSEPIGGSVALDDENGEVQIVLWPMQPGSDLSEFGNTFWRLTQLDGSTGDFSHVVIEINGGAIYFSTPSYLVGFPFDYESSGLVFHPAFTYTTGDSPDRPTGKAFQSAFDRVTSYQLDQTSLTFFDKDRRRLVGLNLLSPTGIENRLWRIAKMRGGTASPDADGLSAKNEPAWIILVNGRVDGTPGCGGFAGTYSLAGDTLTWQVGVIIAGLCPGLDLPYVPSPKEEHPYSGTMRIQKRGNGILLRDHDGYAQMLLVPGR
jgi:heat shock protein HslJ